MTDTIDLNVENYRIEELLSIINLTAMPANKGKIKQRINELNYKFKSKPEIQEFFKNIQERLIKSFEEFNKETWEEAYTGDDSQAYKVLENQYLEREKMEKTALILNNHKNVIGRERLPLDRTLRTKDTVQGDKNPIARDVIKRLVNFDSHFRQILDPSSCLCIDPSGGIPLTDTRCSNETNSDRRLYTATNYTINLNQPLTNVVDMVLHSVQVPNSWYVFSSDYGTNKIKLIKDTSGTSPTWDSVTIEILNGNYQPDQLQDALNNTGTIGSYTKFYMNDVETAYASIPGLSNINFQYNVISNKFTIVNNDASMNLVVVFYDADLSIDACSSTLQGLGRVGDGGKLDYNLGWLLGFREDSLPLSPSSSITGISCVDVAGPRYFYITLDEFNNNRPNKDLISLVDNQTSSFKLPKYFNNQTMDPQYGLGNYEKNHKGEAGYECVDIAGPASDRGCAENALNIDRPENLTQKQLYTVEQIQLARSGRGINRYFSPNSTDLFAKIPVYFNENNKPLSVAYTPAQNEVTRRIYFGPVKLTKFKIRLLHPYGFEVNLNDMDWSFSILVSQLYQY